MKKILFVCTGNTCRSPMAEALARKVFGDKNIDAEVRSAGVYSSGGCASANAAEAVKKYGGDLSRHVSRGVTTEELTWADLVLTMTRSHKALIEKFDIESQGAGGLAAKTFTIYEYAESSDKDVQDPFLGDLDVYEECAEELFKLVNEIGDKLAGKLEDKPTD